MGTHFGPPYWMYPPRDGGRECALHKYREHPALWDISIHLLEISPHYAFFRPLTRPPRRPMKGRKKYGLKAARAE